MKRFIVVMMGLLVFSACSSSSEDSDGQDGDGQGAAAGISIEGVIVGSSENVSVAGLFKLAGIPSDCPDDSATGLSINLSPVENSFKIATRFVRLLSEEGGDDYEISDCTHALASEAEAESVTIGSTTTTICALEEALPDEALGSYDGLEMAIFYVQMTVPMIVPYLSDAEADYPLRVYFNDDDELGILARDILVYSEDDGKWGWINYTDETITFTDEGRPASTLLDAFSNDDYWCADCTANPELCPEESERRACSADSPELSYKDPVTISTRDDSGGVDFMMTNESFDISSENESYTLSLSFDLTDTLTVWENVDDVSDETHTLDVTRDCGFHPLFPSVTITESAE